MWLTAEPSRFASGCESGRGPEGISGTFVERPWIRPRVRHGHEGLGAGPGGVPCRSLSSVVRSAPAFAVFDAT